MSVVKLMLLTLSIDQTMNVCGDHIIRGRQVCLQTSGSLAEQSEAPQEPYGGKILAFYPERRLVIKSHIFHLINCFSLWALSGELPTTNSAFLFTLELNLAVTSGFEA